MFLCCLKALELRPFASLCDSPILPFDNAIIAQFAFTAQGGVKGEFKNFFAPHPAPIGDRPRETLDFIGSNRNMPRISPPATSPSPARKKSSAARGLRRPRASQRAPPRPSALFRAPPSPPPRAPDKRGGQSLFPFALPNGLEPVSPEVLLAAKEIAFWLCKCPCLRQTMCNAVHRANQICYLGQARMNWQGLCDANILKSSLQRLVYQRKGRNRQTRQ